VIQIAGILGIRTISFVRRAEIIPELLSLGASHVFVDDPSGFDAARKVLDGANAALAFNAVGGESALRLLKLLRTGASHVTYGAMARKPLTVPNGLLIFRDLKIRGLWVTRWIESADREDVLKTYDELAGYVASGRLIQLVDRVFPLADWKEAIERLDSPDRAGKVLFVP
jgi:NADPH:quinone reductase-like Zn-dependent oxidoreductase